MKLLTKDKKLNTLIVLTVISVCAAIIILATFPVLFINGKHEFMGNYGGFIGGVLGSIISLITVILVYKTFKLQKKLFKSQKKELVETRNQLKRQQFENIYFKMLDVIYMMGREIQIKDSNDYFKVFFNNLSNDFSSIIVETNTLNSNSIRIIKFIIKYEDGIYHPDDINSLNYRFTILKLNERSRIPSWYLQNKVQHAQIILGAIYEKRFIDSNSSFGNYFRYIINAIDYAEQEITEVEYGEMLLEERKKYIKLLSALLTNNQLVVLFYSCLSRISNDTNGQHKAKKMMEEYEFFKNLLPENLISPWHQEFYEIPYKFPYDKDKEGPEKRL